MMEETQKNHIIKNITRLVECTKNDEVWYNHLLKQKCISPNSLTKIRTKNTKHLRIRETYLECTKTRKFELLIQSLKKSQNHLAANILEEFFATSSTPLNISSKRKNQLTWFGMRSVTKHFKGREEELKTIHDYWLESCIDDKLIFVGLTGLGGMGKSELAKKYALKFYTEVRGHCIWINAENVLTFADSLHRLAKEIGIPLQDSHGKEKTVNSLIIDVFKRFSMDSYLVVFDNLEDYKEDFLQYFVDYATKLPPMQPKPFVILTSRYQLINPEFGCFTKQLELSVLSLTDAVSFFNYALNISEKKLDVLSDLQNLCEELDYFPLAMQQAAAYINEMQRNSDAATEIKEYLKIFKTESKKLLEHQMPKYQGNFSIPTYLTWQMTLDKLSLTPIIGPVVILALDIISFFQSQNISVHLLELIIRLAVSESYEENSVFYERGPNIFETLRNYSMCIISKVDNKVYVSVHRLVQAVSQIKLKEENKWAEMLNMLIQIVNGIFQDTVTSSEISHIVSLLKYTEGCTAIIVELQKFCDLLEKVQKEYIKTGLYQHGKIFSNFAIRQIKDAYGKEASQTLRVMSHYGHTLLKCGEQIEAEKLLIEVYLKQLKIYNESSSNEETHDNDFLNTKQLIATTWQELGKYDEALKMFLEIHHSRQRLLVNEHPTILTTKNSIATIHISKGNYDEALKMYLELLDVTERVLGIDHPDTLTSKNNVATTHDSKGNYDEALKMYLEVLDVRQRVLGIDHPDTLTTKYNIATTHEIKGNYDEALKMYLEVLDFRKRDLGIDHPSTLATMNNIATTYYNKGNYDEALKMLLEVLDVSERVLGIDHPVTLTRKNNIAGTHKSKGNFDEAFKMYLEVLDVRQRTLGIDHPSTLDTKNNIAGTHKSKGNYDEALKMHLEVLAVRERVLGIDHPDTLNTKNNIASTYESKGNYDEALKIFFEVIDVKERVLGIDHPHTLTTKNNLAATHSSNGNYDEALKIYLEVLAISERVLGIDHPDTLTTKNNIALTHNQKGNTDEAIKMFLEVLDVSERVLGNEHPNTFFINNNIAGAHKSKGNYDEALNMYLEVLGISKRVLGIDHPSTLIIKNNIAGTHKSKGSYDVALKMYLEVLDVRQRVLGIDHSSTLTTKNNIAETHESKGNYGEALKMYLEVLDVRQRTLGSYHPSTLETKKNIAGTYKSKGNYDEALKMYLEVLDFRQRVLGIDHMDTLTTKNNIASTLESKENYNEVLKMYF